MLARSVKSGLEVGIEADARAGSGAHERAVYRAVV